MYYFVVDLMAQGCHDLMIKLICKHEVGSPLNTHAVAIKMSYAIECHTLGDIPEKISFVCSIFKRHGGVISCTGNGHKC